MLPFIAIVMCVLAILILVTMAQTAVGVVGAGEGWVIGDEAATRTPVLVEFGGARVVVHDGDTTSALAWSGPNPAELTVLDRLVPDREKGYVLVAVRPAGLKLLEKVTAATCDASNTQAGLGQTLRDLRPDLQRLHAALATQATALQATTSTIGTLAGVTGQLDSARTSLGGASSRLVSLKLGPSLERLGDSLSRLTPVLGQFVRPFVPKAVPMDGENGAASDAE